MWLPSCTAPADVDLHVTAFPLQSPSVQTTTVFGSSWRLHVLSELFRRKLQIEPVRSEIQGNPCISAEDRGLCSCQQLQHIALPTTSGSGTWCRTRFRTLTSRRLDRFFTCFASGAMWTPSVDHRSIRLKLVPSVLAPGPRRGSTFSSTSSSPLGSPSV